MTFHCEMKYFTALLQIIFHCKVNFIWLKFEQLITMLSSSAFLATIIRLFWTYKFASKLTVCNYRAIFFVINLHNNLYLFFQWIYCVAQFATTNNNAKYTAPAKPTKVDLVPENKSQSTVLAGSEVSFHCRSFGSRPAANHTWTIVPGERHLPIAK